VPDRGLNVRELQTLWKLQNCVCRLRRRRGRHSGRKPEADSGTDLAPDIAISDHSRSVVGQEAHAGLDQCRSTWLQCG